MEFTVNTDRGTIKVAAASQQEAEALARRDGYYVYDKYDQAIAYLTDFPNEIEQAWAQPADHPAGCLFQQASRINLSTGNFEKQHPVEAGEHVICIGCLTQIRRDAKDILPVINYVNIPYCAITPDLTKEIALDTRIPDSPDRVGLEHLPVFAEWQRRLDKELNRA